jgi:hypothetical protein
MFRRSLALASMAVLLAGTASAATEKFSATLTPAAEVPASTSTGSGTATVSLDTAAHIHGPAAAGKNAGVVVPLGNNPTSPIHGTHKLTEAQQKELTAGMYYVNVHSKNHPGGAVRGQLEPSK